MARADRTQGLMGLYNERRPGRPRTMEEDQIMDQLDKTLQEPDDGSTHWSVRSMVKETGLSKSTIRRTWAAFGVQPHRQRDAWSGVLRLSAAGPKVQERTVALADDITRRMDELDGGIQRAAEHWRQERRALIDRHILRVGALELADGVTPPKVVLDEAVKVARWFGGSKSPKSPGCVNGVLDRVAPELGRL